MGIGSGIFIFVVGLILALAVQVQVDWIDLRITGYILMGAGLVIFVISLVFALRRRPYRTVRRERVDPATGERVVERRTDEY
ncbi:MULTISPECIES: DUF6458 family protein [unclassified Leifsonia]|uniref:DUF6458 family protein n=1 Tax=unclassified Leifsonia TaxID=2663824 RepID=UPI0008A7BAFA|nr:MULTISPECIES: DUF6458 family protein [unclassified Leifsonia]SEH61789.1 hypothetical protein SAMN04515694_101412 [Leifsonia sp. CL154]SFL17600.1 hypothetical protein SAMN04515692_10166 [Leifsonia sp. CL147]